MRYFRWNRSINTYLKIALLLVLISSCADDALVFHEEELGEIEHAARYFDGEILRIDEIQVRKLGHDDDVLLNEPKQAHWWSMIANVKNTVSIQVTCRKKHPLDSDANKNIRLVQGSGVLFYDGYVATAKHVTDCRRLNKYSNSGNLDESWKKEPESILVQLANDRHSEQKLNASSPKQNKLIDSRPPHHYLLMNRIVSMSMRHVFDISSPENTLSTFRVKATLFSEDIRYKGGPTDISVLKLDPIPTLSGASYSPYIFFDGVDIADDANEQLTSESVGNFVFGAKAHIDLDIDFDENEDGSLMGSWALDYWDQPKPTLPIFYSSTSGLNNYNAIHPFLTRTTLMTPKAGIKQLQSSHPNHRADPLSYPCGLPQAGLPDYHIPVSQNACMNTTINAIAGASGGGVFFSRESEDYSLRTDWYLVGVNSVATYVSNSQGDALWSNIHNYHDQAELDNETGFNPYTRVALYDSGIAKLIPKGPPEVTDKPPSDPPAPEPCPPGECHHEDPNFNPNGDWGFMQYLSCGTSEPDKTAEEAGLIVGFVGGPIGKAGFAENLAGWSDIQGIGSFGMICKGWYENSHFQPSVWKHLTVKGVSRKKDALSNHHWFSRTTQSLRRINQTTSLRFMNKNPRPNPNDPIKPDQPVRNLHRPLPMKMCPNGMAVVGFMMGMDLKGSVNAYMAGVKSIFCRAKGSTSTVEIRLNDDPEPFKQWIGNPALGSDISPRMCPMGKAMVGLDLFFPHDNELYEHPLRQVLIRCADW